MKENFEQRTEEPVQAFAGAPGVPGETTANFLIYPDTDINTFSGGKEAYFSRPGVSYNAGGSANIGQYACFTDGNRGFLLQLQNGPNNSFNLCVRKKSKNDSIWSDRVTLYHSGNLDTSSLLTQESINGKADKTYVDSALANKADKSALANKADKTALNAKADKSYVDDKVAAAAGGIVCSGYVNHSSISCNNGVSGTCTAWGGGSYQINLSAYISGSAGVIITPAATNSGNLCASVDNVNGNTFSVSITKNGSGFDCPFYFQVFKY